MAEIVLPLLNVLSGLGGIATGIGFGVAEKKKMEELKSESDKLAKAAKEVGDLYDNTYYLVAVNAKRVRHAADKLPDDFIKKVEDDIHDITKETDAEKAIALLGQIVGYTGNTMGDLSSIIKAVRGIKARRQANNEPEPTNAEDPESPWTGQPDSVNTPEAGETLPATNTINRLLTGLDVAGAVFSLAGLGVTIGLGVWTIEKLKEALDTVKSKQGEVAKFQKGMTDVLDPMIKEAGLPEKSYSQLQDMAATWKKISVHFEGYSKVLYYAIEGYILKKPFPAIKKLVESKQDAGEKPFPEDAYPLSKTLADDLIVKFKAGLTDQQVVAFFATDEGLRFVFDDFFIGTARTMAGC